jgi:hypothetical protein
VGIAASLLQVAVAQGGERRALVGVACSASGSVALQAVSVAVLAAVAITS